MTSIASTTIARQASVRVAFLLGASDADSGYPFAPETYFVRPSDKLVYAEGFESVRGESDITRSFKRRHGRLMTDADIERAQAEAEADMERMEEETEEYVEDMLDREFWTGGQW